MFQGQFFMVNANLVVRTSKNVDLTFLSRGEILRTSIRFSDSVPYYLNSKKVIFIM